MAARLFLSSRVFLAKAGASAIDKVRAGKDGMEGDGGVLPGGIYCNKGDKVASTRSRPSLGYFELNAGESLWCFVVVSDSRRKKRKEVEAA